MLKRSKRVGRAVVFFLEDFDRFAVQGGGTASSGAAVRLHKICAHHTFPTHSPLQLYNLLDTTHNSGMQFAVLGTSVRTDVLQML